MTPSARLAAAIEVLEAAGTSAGTSARAAEDTAANRVPVDRILAGYFRRRRYAGSKDRAAITGTVYRIVRSRMRLDWWLARHKADATARTRVIADLALSQEMEVDQLAGLFDASEHGPAELTAPERALAASLAGAALTDDAMPLSVRGECPAWIADRIERILGARSEACLAGLATEAGLDLRVNPLVAKDRARVAKGLAKHGLECTATPLSPFGLRVARRRPIDGLKAYKNGAIEVQDEGAQIAALLVGASPGMQVVDYCAGAGGKTLALAAMMENRGRVLALDVAEGRLGRAAVRISRAGLHNVERRVLKGEDDRFLKRQAKRFDRVLVDAPCTGLGTWRRDPEARFKYDEADLARLMAVQDAILASAARLVRPGGRLIYVTCSLLAEENEDRVQALLARRDDYRILPVAEVWRETVEATGGAACPVSDEMLRLYPDLHGTDGFFVAILERRAEPTDPAPHLSPNLAPDDPG